MTLDAKLIEIVHTLKLDKHVLIKGKELDHKKLSFFVQFLLAVYVVWLLSQFTWLFFPAQLGKPIIIASPTSGVSNQSQVVRVDIAGIKALKLFGEVDNKSVEVIPQIQDPDDVPLTTLNLKLVGVVPSTNPKLAAAIIEKSGKQNTYGINEKIDGTSAIVKTIHADRLILEQRGKKEILLLDGVKKEDIKKGSANNRSKARAKPQAKNKSRTSKKRQLKQKLNAENAKKVKEYRKDVMKDPGKINEYIKASPVKENGKLVGYRIRPGKSIELFNAFGLRSGDIAVEINGYDLTNFSQAVQAMQELRSANEATVLVQRNGEIIEILMSLY